MTDVNILIQSLPDPESSQRFLVQLAEKHPAQERRLRKKTPLLSDILTLVSYSPLIAATILQHPEYIAWLERKRGESIVRNKDELLESLARFSLTSSQIEAHVLLSRFRRRELLRIYLRDIRRLATVAEITEEISNLADAILEHALRLARQELDNKYGPPLETDDKGRKRPAEICIVSLGKLGSKELNYASDIDLLFIYSGEGTTAGVGSREPITNREYFIKLAETITKLIAHQAGEGAAYRVDLRLRPHGRVGPLSLSLADTVRYYTDEAAAWERQVLIRSRSSAGFDSIFKSFFSKVAESVFSVEATASDALRNVRESKQKIDLENINSRGTNVKLGKGGIREIEFIAQALQLAYGGKDRWLRAPHTLISLTRLADRKLIHEHELTQLADAYAFLRQLEHILQMEHGLQTHTLPLEDRRSSTVARRMGYSDLAGFEKDLSKHTNNVHSVFTRVFDEESAEPNVPNGLEHSEATGSEDDSDPVIRLIKKAPRLKQFSVEMLRSIDLNIDDILQRDYRALLSKSVGESVDRLGALRRTWRSLSLEILAFDALEKITIRRSKDLQTQLAEASIAAAISIAESDLRRRFPDDDAPQIAVLGLGKLGGSGVDHDSDLDLVMSYRAASRLPAEHELANRFVESIVNTLSAMTRDGSLYRVDMRLRPHGNDGALAISTDAFLEYIRESAAIWELLAFMKLRAVGGEAAFASETEDHIRETIFQKAASIHPSDLADETRRIRTRLELSRTKQRRSGEVDIKYGSGGMLDVYFAIRYLQLRDNVPDDRIDRSTHRTLELLHAASSLDEEQYRSFSDGYEFLSALDHHLRVTIGRTTRLPLANRKALDLIAERMRLSSAEDLLAALNDIRLQVRDTYNALVPEHC
jgi:glutamate-ammonia-ligase adenylyltransferase